MTEWQSCTLCTLTEGPNDRVAKLLGDGGQSINESRDENQTRPPMAQEACEKKKKKIKENTGRIRLKKNRVGK